MRRGSQTRKKFGWSLGMGVSGAGEGRDRSAERPELPELRRLGPDCGALRWTGGPTGGAKEGLVGGTRVEPQEVKTCKRGARSPWWVGSRMKRASLLPNKTPRKPAVVSKD